MSGRSVRRSVRSRSSRKSDRARRLRERAHEIADRISAHEEAFLRSLGARIWADGLWPQYRAPEVRRSIHADSLIALAGYAEASEERPGHLSDWLRLQVCLLLGLAGDAVGKARDFLFHETRAELTTEAALRPFRSELEALHEELPSALGAFGCLPGLNRIEDFTRTNIERYWDESARAAPLFTIDWASFGREDLFDFNGRRAAEWLAEGGYAGPRDRVLQIGCGAGRIERHLASRVEHVYGVDISAEMIKLANARLAGASNVTLIHADGRTLPLPDRSVNTVFSFLVLIHVHDPTIVQSLLAEAFRVLIPGGRCVITLDARNPLLELAAMLAGFKIIRSGAVDSRRINSFSYEPDWLVELGRPAA